MTNRKPHNFMRFRLVPKSMTLDDLDCYKFNIFLRNFALVRILETTSTKRMKIDDIGPYYQRQKCRPMALVSGNIRRMQIFAGVPLGGGVK